MLSQPQLQQLLPLQLLQLQPQQLLLQLVKTVAIGVNVNARERRPRDGVTGTGSRRTARRLVDLAHPPWQAMAGWPLLSDFNKIIRQLSR